MRGAGLASLLVSSTGHSQQTPKKARLFKPSHLISFAVILPLPLLHSKKKRLG